MKYVNLVNEAIFKRNKYFKECHASSILPLSDNTVLVTYFAGDKEQAPNTEIYLSRKINDEWTEPIKITHHNGEPCWNPVLYEISDDHIICYYKVGFNCRDWSTYYIESFDKGKTWLKSKELVKGDKQGRGPVKNKMIKLSNGNIIAPASHEILIDKVNARNIPLESLPNGVDINSFKKLQENDVEIEIEQWKSFIDISLDGKNFNKSDYIDFDHILDEKDGIIQPTIWESDNRNVHMLMRSTRGVAYRSDSSDYGHTWSKAYKSSLPNNNSGLDLVKLDEGVLVCVYNPISKNWGARTPLALAISYDNGFIWEQQYILEQDNGEYSYPSIQYKNNKLYITYTDNRKTIQYIELELDFNSQTKVEVI